MTPYIAPRTPDQRTEALQYANMIRTVRAELKKNIKAGRVSVLTILYDPPPELATMKVYALLIAMPQWGAHRATKVMGRCRLASSKTVGGVTSRQRAELAATLEAMGVR